MSQDLFSDIHFFQTNLGVLIGSAGLLLLWLLLTQLAQRGQHIGSVMARAINRPLLLGLGSSLYLGWISKLITDHFAPFDPRLSLRLSASISAIAFVWAISRLGHAVLLSRRVERWLQLDDPKDRAMALHFLRRTYTILMIVAGVGALMGAFGVPPTALAALGGGAGVGLALGTQKIAQNFFSGFVLFFNRPFKEGDWISVNNFEGTVESIGWYHTRLRTFARRPMYIPNAMLITNTITNPGQMYNRRIKANIGLRHEDIPSMQAITADIQQMLENHPDIDQGQLILVNFTAWETASINLMVYCFTKTTVWKEYLKIQQDVFLNIANIIQSNHASFALNCTTVYPATNLNTNDLVRQLSAPNQGPEG
ncbi:mechanosensitive ion channel family protein [Parasynechococcus sp.]|jgi:MscS family membrane protein|uniref:mechanosensitive ion channel family protein n=1 Tax=Parasynechococcus sp. TaxID=3101203 RepID=UPI003704490A